MDIFDLFNEQYLLVIDYYSKYIELMSLDHDLTSDVIMQVKSIFAHHGIMQIVISSFTSGKFKEFARE